VETEHSDIDRVSRFLRILAIGKAVIGVAFATLDRLELLPPAAVTGTPCRRATCLSLVGSQLITPWLSGSNADPS
jgi:hypothetical protein